MSEKADFNGVQGINRALVEGVQTVSKMTTVIQTIREEVKLSKINSRMHFQHMPLILELGRQRQEDV